MSFKQVSKQTCLVYRSVRNCKDWITVREIVADIDANPRTVRGILKALVSSGVVLSQSTFAGFRYTLVDKPSTGAREIVDRITSAEKTLRLTEKAT